jgi:AcrR family transcriptional regulator
VYHFEMAVSRKPDLRANQKERTRAALVEAARALLRAGTPPTVAAAAVEARVSRATAYRYFPTPESLVLEAGSIASVAQPVEALVENFESGSPEERLVALLDCFNPIALSAEVSMRTALRTYLDTWLQHRGRGEAAVPVREGRRMRWLDKVLEPARHELSDAQYRRLRCALALTLSIDALVVMKDVCRTASDREALDVLKWAAVSMLRSALAERRARRSAAGKKRT